MTAVAQRSSPNTLTAQFSAYGNSGAGWTGADSTYSTPLPDRRQLFTFSDTFLGPVSPDGTRPRTAPLINNAFVVRDRAGFTTVHGGTPDNPAAVLQSTDPGRWYWFGAGLARRTTHEQIAVEFARTGPGPWDFTWVGTSLARFAVDRLSEPVDVQPLPAASRVTWSAWLQQIGSHLYVYGVEDSSASKYLHVARVCGDSLLGAWSYWTGCGWSAKETDSARILRGVANEYSVTPWRGRYLLVTHDTTELFSATIVAYTAATPVGPFTGKTLLYTTPETGAAGSYANPNVYTYNAHAHPGLSRRSRLVISYNVNSLATDDVYHDATIYRPRFINAGRTLAT